MRLPVLMMLVLLPASALASADEAGAVPDSVDARASAAIVAAVRGRMGNDVEVTVEDLHVRGRFDDANGIIASLDPAVRLGEATRVGLRGLRGRSQGPRLGEASCVIRVKTRFSRLVSAVARATVIPANAVREDEGWIETGPAAPVVSGAAGMRTLRPLAPGDVVLAHDVIVPPAVRNGDPVRLQIVSGLVEVSVDAVAGQDGHIGEEIRIVNPSSGRVLRGRVVGPRLIEVIHGS